MHIYEFDLLTEWLPLNNRPEFPGIDRICLDFLLTTSTGSLLPITRDQNLYQKYESLIDM